MFQILIASTKFVLTWFSWSPFEPHPQQPEKLVKQNSIAVESMKNGNYWGFRSIFNLNYGNKWLENQLHLSSICMRSGRVVNYWKRSHFYKIIPFFKWKMIIFKGHNLSRHARKALFNKWAKNCCCFDQFSFDSNPYIRQ